MVRAGQIAQGLRQVVLIGIALLLPWLGISRNHIGQWEQMQYIGYLLGFAWLTGLGQAYLAGIRSLPEEAAQALTNRLLRISLGITVVLGVLCLLLERPLLQLLQNEADLPGWRYYLFFLMAHWPGLLYEQVLMAQKKAKRLIIFSLASNGALAFGILGPLLFGVSWADTLLFLLVIATLKFLLLLSPTSWQLRKKGEHHYPLLKKSGALIGYAAIGALVVSFDPWFVNFWYAGDASLFALYRYGTRELPLIVAITNGIGMATLPMLGENISNGLAQLKRSSLRLMHLFFPLTLLLLLTSHWWWTALFTSAFADSLPLFQIFVFVGISRMIFPIVILTAKDYGHILLILGAIELVLNAGLSWWLVQDYGLAGIVWATVLAYTVDKLLAAVWLYFKEGIPLQAYCHWPWLLGYTGLLLSVYRWLTF